MFFPFHDDNPTRRTPVVTFGLIAVNTIAFLWSTQLPTLERHELNLTYGFIPARIGQVTAAQPAPLVLPAGPPMRRPGPIAEPVQPLVRLPASATAVAMSLLTCMFLHGGLWHLIGNMWFLWLFGNNVEDHLGPLPFIAVYLVGGLAASACHWLSEPSSTVPVIGASGAVATTLGAYLVTWPWARVHTLVFLFIFITIIDVPAVVVLGVWFLGQLMSGHQALQAGQAQGVAWWAHVGGFIAGMGMMPIVGRLVGAPKVHRGTPAHMLRRRRNEHVEDAEWW